MGCLESTPVDQGAHHRNPTTTPRPTTATRPQNQGRTTGTTGTRRPATNQTNRTTAANRTTTTGNKKYKTEAAKKAEIKRRVEAKKRTVEYQKKQTELQEQKRKAAEAKNQHTKSAFVPKETALKRDINTYRRKSATYSGNTDAPEDENQFLKQAENLIPAEVRMISGCEDAQTSADVMNAGGNLPDPKGRAGGAATSALLELLYKHQNEKFSFQEALVALREKLQQQGHTQIPQLTSSRPLDLDETPFTFHNDNTNGTRRAILVGINYVGQQGQLRGCHNDVYRMKDYLMNIHGFNENDIVVLTDDGSGDQPTKKKMIDELIRLVDISKADDSVFFHYSGHGGFLEADQNPLKEKNDQYDQTLIPLDHRHAGQIRDFNLFNHFVRPMSAGVNVTCLMDCCHSGSVLDLPYSFKPTNEGKYRQETNFGDMAGIALLAILAGVVLDSLLFDPIFGTLESILGDLTNFEGLYADMLYEDLIERAVEEEMEREIENDIEREIELEVEREIEREIEQEVQREIEREIELEIQREVEREIQREAEREIQREVEREIQREAEREIEREIQNEMENAMFDDMLGGGSDEFW